MRTQEQLTTRFEQRLTDVADRSVNAVLQVVAAFLAGKVTLGAAASLITRAIGGHNTRGRVMADVFATAMILDQTGRPASPGGLLIPDELDRLTDATNTILAADKGPESVRTRAERLAGSEPVNAAQQQAVATYSHHGISGYVRGLNGTACELCHWLRKEHLRPGGFIYPTDQPMHRHPGCKCTPIPTKETTP